MASSPKNPLTSRLNLLGLLVTIIGLLQTIAGSEVLAPYPRAIGIIAVVTGCLIIVLRQLTSTPTASLRSVLRRPKKPPPPIDPIGNRR